MLPLSHQQRLKQDDQTLSAFLLSLVLRHSNFCETNANLGLLHRSHQERISKAVALGLPLSFVLPAFPAKSPNRQKTLGPLPDYAEVLALIRLEKLCQDIQKVYSPGAKVIICSDGRVFSDLVGVPDADVSAYQQSLSNMLSKFAPSLSGFGLEDIYGAMEYNRMRTLLVGTHGSKLDSLRQELQLSASARILFNGVHRFIFEDSLALEPEKSRSRVRKEAKEKTYAILQRSNAWSQLVESVFSDAVRLSIHPQLVSSSKLGFRLIDGDNIWATPWHGVAAFDGKSFALLKRCEAEARGMRLEQINSYSYYCIREAL